MASITLHLQGAGEIFLIDDVRLTKKNSPFSSLKLLETESGLLMALLSTASVEIIGTHIDSQTVVDQSKHGRKSLRLLASSSGNTGPNHVEIPLQFPLVAGDDEYLISFWAKWQKGSNLLLTRCSETSCLKLIDSEN